MSLADTVRRALAVAPAEASLAGDLDAGTGMDRKPASVLIALTDRAEPGVILTVRRDDMRTHAGQIAFPGGRLDPGEGPVDAALREAWEEIGLSPSAVEVVGALDPYRTITDYLVTPVVAVVPPDLPLAPHEPEVADLFEAPLDLLLNPANHRLQSALFDGRRRHYYEIEWSERRIWGATAAMIVNLSRRLRWS